MNWLVLFKCQGFETPWLDFDRERKTKTKELLGDKGDTTMQQVILDSILNQKKDVYGKIGEI